MQLQINGTSYPRWEDVPEETRRALLAVLPDEDGDGVPDSLQGRGGGMYVRKTTKVKINGVEYDSPDQMPAEARMALRAAGLPLPGATDSRQTGAPPDDTTSQLTRELLGEAPPRKWWQIWRR